jgi:hypothetical protein
MFGSRVEVLLHELVPAKSKWADNWVTTELETFPNQPDAIHPHTLCSANS